MYGSLQNAGARGNLWRWLMVAAIFAAALLIRLAYAHHSGEMLTWADEYTYNDIATNIVDGNGFSFSSKTGTGLTVTMYIPPAQPYLLAAVYSVYPYDIMAAKYFIGLLGALTCVFVYLAGVALTRKHLVGVLAALGTAFYPAFIYCCSTFYPVVLIAFSLSIALWTVLKAKAGTKPVTAAIIAGLAIGVAGLSAPYHLLIAPLAGLWLLGVNRSLWKTTAPAAIAITLAAALAVTPWIVRNYVIFKKPALSGNFGRSLAVGTLSAEITDGGKVRITAPMFGQQESKKDDAETVAEVLKVVRENPVHYARLSLGKFLVFWESYPSHPITGRKPKKIQGLIQTAYVASFYILALGGLLLLPKLRRYYGLVTMFMLPTLLSCILIISTPRYRYPLDTLLILAASAALVLIWDRRAGSKKTGDVTSSHAIVN